MDSHRFRILCKVLGHVNRVVPTSGRKKTFSDVLIVKMYLWSVAHDRPLHWASDRRNYDSSFRPAKLPSNSQFCKRLKSPRVQALLTALSDRLARTDSPTFQLFLDARPFVVGSCTKDNEARAGRVSGGFGKGYKLHALVTADGRTLVWCVMPLNVAESTVALELINQARHKGIILADANYDRNPLFEAAAAHGGQLLTPKRRGKAYGHRQQSEARLTAHFVYRRARKILWRRRVRVESVFGNQSSYGGGLGPLPSWVRTLERVRRWIGAKLILHHARLAVNSQVA